MNDTKLSLCMIVKNNDPSERENLPKLFESVRDHVDEICVTVTYKGEDPDPEFCSWLQDTHDCEISLFEWCNDFSAAREHSFKQATHELVLWLDADDVFENGKELPLLCERFKDNPDLTSIWISYDYDYDADGNVAMKVPRERIIRKSIHRWVGKLHENLICTYMPIVDITDESICKIKHMINHEEVEEKALRNLNIIKEEYLRQRKVKEVDPRTVFDLARSFHALCMLEEAKAMFLEFLTMTDSNSDMYDSYCRISDICKAVGSFNEARDYAMQAIKTKHDWPDGYHALAYVAFIEEKYNECMHWLKTAEKLKPPKGVLPHDPTKYKARPLALAQECYFRMNKPQEALICAKKALVISPSSEALQQAVKMIEQFLYDQDVELSYVTVLGDLRKTGETLKAEKILECVPNSMADHPFISKMRNQYHSKKTKNRLVIYCHESYEAWSPKSVESGIGGSEEAVINMSKQLAKLGWNVEVFCDCDAPGEYNDVKWQQFYVYDKNVPCDVFIGWRMNEFISIAPPNAYKILWLHDKQKLDYYKEDLIDKIDKIFVLSEYHRKDLPDLPDEKFYVTRNGIDPEQFEGKIEVGYDPNWENRYIYASSPDRGLHKLLDSWLEIKTINPKAELHVFYGFNKVYDKIQEHDTRRKVFKEKIMKQVKELPDIHWHGRVGHQELADWFMKCGFWLYPCTFDEISCITAMKAQAAGCWPICTDFAALAETVKYGTVTKGNVEDPNVLKDWVKSVERAMKQDHPRSEMRELALDFFSWETLAKDWSEKFVQWMDEKKKVSVVA